MHAIGHPVKRAHGQGDDSTAAVSVGLHREAIDSGLHLARDGLKGDQLS